MAFQTWRCLARSSCLVALAIGAWAPALAYGWGGEPVSLALPADDTLLAAIPRPPDPPPLPAGILSMPLDPAGLPDADPGPAGAADGVAEPATPPERALKLDDPIFQDPRADSLPVYPLVTAPAYPVVINAQVEALMDYFLARERDRFSLWIARSGRYLSMIRRIFRERGLPEELAYTAMIESGFSPRAVSRVGAKGMWQFMEATARRYGLVVNRWVDERLDPIKATIAAAAYLGDLYSMFGHWFLAQAAYNAGEARVGRAIQRARTSDFWALTQTRHLPDETKRFVPQILAAMVITRAPSRYGFDVTPERPLEYEEVTVKRALDFETIAALARVTVDEIRELNPALRGGITPPFGSYVLRLPPGSAAVFEAALQETPPAKLVSWGVHRIARNETLAGIARLYRIAPARLAEVNGLASGRLRGVSELLVPVSNKVVAVPAVAASSKARVVAKPVPRARPKAPVRVAEREERSPVRSR